MFARLKAFGAREQRQRQPVPSHDLPELHSERLILRPLTAADTDLVYAVIDNSRDEFSRWFTWAHDSSWASVRQSLQEAQIAMMAGSEWHYGIFAKPSGPFLGRIGLSEIDRRTGSAELGYWLDRDWHGRGMMTEAVGLLLSFAASGARRVSIHAYADVENRASQCVLRKCGFREVGSVLNAVNHPLRGWRDQFHYLLASDDGR